MHLYTHVCSNKLYFYWPNPSSTVGKVVSTSPTTWENNLYIGSNINSTKLLGDVVRGAFFVNLLVFSLKYISPHSRFANSVYFTLPPANKDTYQQDQRKIKVEETIQINYLLPCQINYLLLTCSWHDKLIILWILNRQAKISLCILATSKTCQWRKFIKIANMLIKNLPHKDKKINHEVLYPCWPFLSKYS